MSVTPHPNMFAQVRFALSLDISSVRRSSGMFSKNSVITGDQVSLRGQFQYLKIKEFIEKTINLSMILQSYRILYWMSQPCCSSRSDFFEANVFRRSSVRNSCTECRKTTSDSSWCPSALSSQILCNQLSYPSGTAWRIYRIIELSYLPSRKIFWIQN